MKSNTLVTVTLLMAIAAVACDEEKAGQDSTEINIQESALRSTTIVNEDSDVRMIRFVVTACDDPTVEYIVDKPIEDQLIPETIPEFINNMLDENSEHLFSDYFQVVDPGCYNVEVIPLDENGEPPQMCFPAHKDNIVVEEGQTTEIFLMIQCLDEDQGAIDVIAAINHEPELDDVTFSDSKFVCGDAEQICASAHDVDGDPLEFELVAPDFCGVEVVQEPEGDPMDEIDICWRLTCQQAGKADLIARVYDLIWRDDALVRIEDWLEDEGYASESHGQLQFHAYFDCL
jgi:hypothetical protein